MTYQDKRPGAGQEAAERALRLLDEVIAIAGEEPDLELLRHTYLYYVGEARSSLARRIASGYFSDAPAGGAE